MPKKRKYTDEQFIETVKNNYSISACLKELGLKPTGGNYKLFHKRLVDLNIDHSHFTGQGHLKGKNHNWTPKRKLEGDILTENSCYNSKSLRKRLIKEGYKKHICECCNNKKWNGKPIPLELDHINGINTDNRLENLRLICPNCHAQTETYRGKNKRKE